MFRLIHAVFRRIVESQCNQERCALDNHMIRNGEAILRYGLFSEGGLFDEDNLKRCDRGRWLMGHKHLLEIGVLWVHWVLSISERFGKGREEARPKATSVFVTEEDKVEILELPFPLSDVPSMAI